MLTEEKKLELATAVDKGFDLLDRKFVAWWKNVVDVNGEFNFSSWSDCLLGKCSQGPRQPDGLLEDPFLNGLTGRSWAAWLFDLSLPDTPLGQRDEKEDRLLFKEMVSHGFEAPNGHWFEDDAEVSEADADDERRYLAELWVRRITARQREEGYEAHQVTAV